MFLGILLLLKKHTVLNVVRIVLELGRIPVSVHAGFRADAVEPNIPTSILFIQLSVAA